MHSGRRDTLLTPERTALKVFFEAVDLEASARLDWIAKACRGDALLLARVIALMEYDSEVALLVAEIEGAPPPEMPPGVIGLCRLEALIGACGARWRGWIMHSPRAISMPG